jgi:hypothetical protein
MLVAGAGALAAGCAELTAWLTIPDKPLVEPALESPKAILFLEQDGAMTPFLCGADGKLGRDKTCAGRVPVGARLQSVGGEGLLVEKTAYRDCGAGESVEVSPKPSIRTVGLWSADGKATLEKPRDASSLPTQEWQRLSPKLLARASKDLNAEPSSLEVLGWVSGELDGVVGTDLLVSVEATPAPGGSQDTYRAIIIEAGTEERSLLVIATETKRREPPLDLVTAVDIDGDNVLEVVTGGDVWSISKSIEGKPTDVAAWYCYRARAGAPASASALAP